MMPGHTYGDQEQCGGEGNAAEAEVEEGHLGVGPIGLAVSRRPVGRPTGSQHPRGPWIGRAPTEAFEAGGDRQQRGGVPGQEGGFGVQISAPRPSRPPAVREPG
jgi:hypothetical protein